MKYLFIVTAMLASVAAFANHEETTTHEVDHRQVETPTASNQQVPVTPQVEEDRPVPNRHPAFYQNERTAIANPGYMRK